MAAQMTAPKIAPQILGETDTLLQSLGIPRDHYTDGSMAVHSPIPGRVRSRVTVSSIVCSG